MKKLFILTGLAILLIGSNNANAQNWGFMLPNGAGFRINGKSWGVALPYGGGFGAGGPNRGAGYCGYPTASYVPYVPTMFRPSSGIELMDRRVPWRDCNGWIRRGPRPIPAGYYSRPNIW